ncbi:GNAT family N-acetyltransferase [Ruminococcus sp. NK3A76]|uniref:GNAT family N-acetyltransferase n=1 Tax=Ruminococcus sp. NK3A76 TaxID=877411 RepID=UPI00048BC46B|nr:GNAT family N-acetyltransferase [Ruminococcus sp. NK3A76]
MQITNYFDSDDKAHWLDEIGRCEWAGGKYLHELLENGSFFDLAGEGARVLMLVEGGELLSFCTYAPKDDIQPTDLTPWVGFVYTYPEHRGRRLFGLLLDEAVRLAASEGREALYISTDHVGLYEKYGCEFLRTMTDVHGGESRVYIKRIADTETVNGGGVQT